MTIKTTAKQRELLRHALGIEIQHLARARKRGFGKCYRNYFTADEESIDWDDLQALAKAGLMERREARGLCVDHVFHVTELGFQEAVS